MKGCERKYLAKQVGEVIKKSSGFAILRVGLERQCPSRVTHLYKTRDRGTTLSWRGPKQAALQSSLETSIT